MESLAFLARQAAVIAVLAGSIALSIAAFVLGRYAGRRRARRRDAEARGRRLVRKLRLCPGFAREQDRKLIGKIAAELDAFVAAERFTLEELGTSRAEVQKLVRQVEDESAPVTPQVAKLNELMAVHREMRRRPRPVPTSSEPPFGPSVLETVPAADRVPEAEPFDPFGHTFSEEDFPPSGEVEIDMSGILAARAADDAPASFTAGPVEPQAEHVFDPADLADRSPPATDWSDPVRALRAAGDDELDAYVEDRIAAIQLRDKKD